jgi:beta-xylosidase
MIAGDGTYFLFTSHQAPGAGPNVPVRAATVVGHWGPVTDALPQLPAWAEPGWAWAPDVRRFGDHDVLYFTALVRGSSPATMCIGDAVGTRITGPYMALPTPIVCQFLAGGSIDPRTFVDKDGQAYLLWKSDENAVSHVTPTRIYSQLLSADGLDLLGRATQIFGPDEAWQGDIVEAPDLMQIAGAYFLFYSGYWFNQPGYAIGVADCAGPLGPCADPSPAPLLRSNEQGTGPGEESVFADARGIWLLYAPFHSSFNPSLTPPRPATVARLGFGHGGVYLAATPGDPGDT